MFNNKNSNDVKSLKKHSKILYSNPLIIYYLYLLYLFILLYNLFFLKKKMV